MKYYQIILVLVVLLIALAVAYSQAIVLYSLNNECEAYYGEAEETQLLRRKETVQEHGK